MDAGGAGVPEWGTCPPLHLPGGFSYRVDVYGDEAGTRLPPSSTATGSGPKRSATGRSRVS